MKYDAVVVIFHNFKNGLTLERLDPFASHLKGSCTKERCFVSLAFLPREDVIDGFEELVDDDDIPQALVSYFENAYRTGTRKRSKKSETRTNISDCILECS